MLRSPDWYRRDGSGTGALLLALVLQGAAVPWSPPQFPCLFVWYDRYWWSTMWVFLFRITTTLPCLSLVSPPRRCGRLKGFLDVQQTPPGNSAGFAVSEPLGHAILRASSCFSDSLKYILAIAMQLFQNKPFFNTKSTGQWRSSIN